MRQGLSLNGVSQPSRASLSHIRLITLILGDTHCNEFSHYVLLRINMIQGFSRASAIITHENSMITLSRWRSESAMIDHARERSEASNSERTPEKALLLCITGLPISSLTNQDAPLPRLLDKDPATKNLLGNVPCDGAKYVIVFLCTSTSVTYTNPETLLDTIRSGSCAYETARTECSTSRSSIFTCVTFNGSETGSDPIERADLGACGLPPMRNTFTSLKLEVLAYGDSSLDRPWKYDRSEEERGGGRSEEEQR
ncbi:hypothetical protein F2Q69_00046383 [Brassica cretica]|uniref:Uncharacterized protein n=1 Tax=Brassica cretica TaxID=69181 RepID=A0A8S9PS97_BRACR|nr:hypothetical protein F2Q69_00046383 [Brassica cretica]